MTILQHQNQLIQLARLNPTEADRAMAALNAGLEKSAIRIIIQAMQAEMTRLTRPVVIDETDPTHWPRTLSESIECLLGQDHEANRQARAAEKRITKPTNEQAQRALELALKPGGGGPLHRPRYQFGK